ncbi:MAG: chorismate synthase [Candidatus Marinimicrobia bacterium]|nr:chorismate synthase [Candidatus Neomarinimicrobiota bacterium]
MNNFGRLFKIQIFGESHGAGVGVIIDGCPAGLRITESDLMSEISRRKSGKIGTTARTESDLPEILSGILNECTTGSPISIVFKNQDIRSESYQAVRDIPRPGHADFVADRKFSGFNDIRGGGHFSGRLTLGLVAAGAIAKKLIEPTMINAKILEIGGEADFEKIIEKAQAEGDSVGGLIECRIQGVPVGLGEPFFDSVESLISHLIFSIPGIKSIEFGSGFQAAKLRGSAHNDLFIDKNGTTSTNNAGGINGGITNGNDIIFRVAVKPTSSISKSQHTLNFATGEPTELSILGRHDACIALRAPVIVEAVAAIVLADLFLLEQKIARRTE